MKNVINGYNHDVFEDCSNPEALMVEQWENNLLFWATSDGDEILVQNMETSHILNTIRFLEEKFYGNQIYQAWVRVFNFELEERG